MIMHTFHFHHVNGQIDNEVINAQQGRINHCAGCTMGGAAAARGPRLTANIFPRLFWRLNVWTFSVGLNVMTIKNRWRKIWGKKSGPAEKHP